MNAASVASMLGAILGGSGLVVAVLNAVIGRGGRRADVTTKIREAAGELVDDLRVQVAEVKSECKDCKSQLGVERQARVAAEIRIAALEDRERTLQHTIRTTVRAMDSNDPTAIEAAITAAREMV